jgi:hypothetical protein
MKLALIASLVGSASAFAPASSGGMFRNRDVPIYINLADLHVTLFHWLILRDPAHKAY